MAQEPQDPGFDAIERMVQAIGHVGSRSGALASISRAGLAVRVIGDAAEREGLAWKRIWRDSAALLLLKTSRLVIELDVLDPLLLIEIELHALAQASGYFGAVAGQLWRHSTVAATGQASLLPVYRFGVFLSGPPGSAEEQVHIELDQIVTSFVSEWYRDNP